jgi:hypothetical protein
MSSSRSTIDEALSPDDLGDLSRVMFPEEEPGGKGEREEPPAQNAGPEEQADVDNSPSDARAGENQGKGPQEKSPNAPPLPAQPSEDRLRESPKESPEGSRKGRPSKPSGKRPKKTRRQAERPTFTIGDDQMATLRVVGSLRTDPLGASASAIARCLFDLFGYNGAHLVASLHGKTLGEGASVPGRLIEKRQWEDLLQKAEEMLAASKPPSPASRPDGHDDSSLDEGAPEGTSREEGEARLACVCFLVQEALYEAGFGDRRRRRKGPL